MKTIVITYKGVMIKDLNLGVGRRATPGDVVTIGGDDAALLIGMGRAKAFEPPKDPQKEPEKEPPKEERNRANCEGREKKGKHQMKDCYGFLNPEDPGHHRPQEFKRMDPVGWEEVRPGDVVQ